MMAILALSLCLVASCMGQYSVVMLDSARQWHSGVHGLGLGYSLYGLPITSVNTDEKVFPAVSPLLIGRSAKIEPKKTEYTYAEPQLDEKPQLAPAPQFTGPQWAPVPQFIEKPQFAPVPQFIEKPQFAPVPQFIEKPQFAPIPQYVTPQYIVTPTVSRYQAQDELGRYAFGHASPDQVREEVKELDGSVRGGYSYTDPTGKINHLQYIADARGFRVTGNNLPVAPVAPVVELKGPVDTPEVKAAKIEFLKQFEKEEKRDKVEEKKEEVMEVEEMNEHKNEKTEEVKDRKKRDIFYPFPSLVHPQYLTVPQYAPLITIPDKVEEKKEEVMDKKEIYYPFTSLVYPQYIRVSEIPPWFPKVEKVEEKKEEVKDRKKRDIYYPFSSLIHPQYLTVPQYAPLITAVDKIEVDKDAKTPADTLKGEVKRTYIVA